MKTCCTVLYEGWQMQCCGQPFSINDMVRWDVFAFNETITDIPQTIEYIYDAHYETSDGLLTLQGIVHQINAIYTKYKASTDNPQLLVPVSSLLKSLVKADGNEEEVNGMTFDSYIVVLGDVSIKRG
mgnify:FL=1